MKKSVSLLLVLMGMSSNFFAMEQSSQQSTDQLSSKQNTIDKQPAKTDLINNDAVAALEVLLIGGFDGDLIAQANEMARQVGKN